MKNTYNYTMDDYLTRENMLQLDSTFYLLLDTFFLHFILNLALIEISS